MRIWDVHALNVFRIAAPLLHSLEIRIRVGSPISFVVPDLSRYVNLRRLCFVNVVISGVLLRSICLLSLSNIRFVNCIFRVSDEDWVQFYRDRDALIEYELSWGDIEHIDFHACPRSARRRDKKNQRAY